jgi:hypothetical protein
VGSRREARLLFWLALVTLFGIVLSLLRDLLGAIFAIPTAAAILAVTDYLKERDVLLRAADVADAVDPPIRDTPGAGAASAAGSAT